MMKSRTSRIFLFKIGTIRSSSRSLSIYCISALVCPDCAMFHVKQYISAKKVERLPLILFVAHAVFLYVLRGAAISREGSRGRTVKVKM